MIRVSRYEGLITWKPGTVLVFGSNTEGRHGKGMAKFALEQFGAIYGQSKGRQGMSYAIVTKDLKKRIHPSVSKFCIAMEIIEMYNHATANPHEIFQVAYTGSGTNLNAYKACDMADMFAVDIPPSNVEFESEFADMLDVILNNVFKE